jgi:hypothetical protein
MAHYGEQKGDMMRDPEMLFEVSESGDEMELSSFLKRPPLNKNCAARLYTHRS